MMPTILDYWLRYSGFMMSGLLSLTRFLCDHFPFHVALAITMALPVALYYAIPFIMFKMLTVAVIAPFLTFLIMAVHAAMLNIAHSRQDRLMSRREK